MDSKKKFKFFFHWQHRVVQLVLNNMLDNHLHSKNTMLKKNLLLFGLKTTLKGAWEVLNKFLNPNLNESVKTFTM